MMSDLKYQACRKLVIIMLTELGVRGGPSLFLSLVRVDRPHDRFHGVSLVDVRVLVFLLPTVLRPGSSSS